MKPRTDEELTAHIAKLENRLRKALAEQRRRMQAAYSKRYGK